MEVVRVNIGASKTYIPGFRNIDISPRAEISLDIGRDPLPFSDSSVNLVFTYHTLEHIPDYLFALGEIFRVLKHGGRLLVGVPYVTSSEFNLVNPYHKHHFNEFSFDFFDPQKLSGSASEEDPPCFEKIFHRFHYMREFDAVSEPMLTWCRRHLFNVVKKIDFGLIAIKELDRKPPGLNDAKIEMLEEFDRCVRARREY